MRILFLSQRVPYPPNRGDKILTWRLVERMARRHDVTIVAFAHDAGDLEAAQALEDKGLPTLVVPHDPTLGKLKGLPRLLRLQALTLGVYGSRALQAIVDHRASSHDLMYGFSSSMGAFMLPHADHARVMHFAELDSDKWRQYAEREPLLRSLVYRYEHWSLARFERALAHAMDENVLCTPLEERIFRREIPGASSCVLENGVDLAYFSPRPRPAAAASGPPTLVFTGVMNYLPNVDGCTFFAHEVLPKLQARHPDVRFVIVGSQPTPEVRALGERPGVTVTGFVPDVRTYLAEATISVAPLRIARGIQNKALEAMAMGLPVVASPSAVQGIAGVDGRDFVVADGADATAAAVLALLDDPARAEALGRAARAYVEAHHDWEHNFAGVEEVIARAVERRRVRRARPA